MEHQEPVGLMEHQGPAEHHLMEHQGPAALAGQQAPVALHQTEPVEQAAQAALREQTAQMEHLGLMAVEYMLVLMPQ